MNARLIRFVRRLIACALRRRLAFEAAAQHVLRRRAEAGMPSPQAPGSPRATRLAAELLGAKRLGAELLRACRAPFAQPRSYVKRNCC